MKLPPPPGPHLSVDELVQVCCAPQDPAAETEARAIHHLALLCPECWAALDELPAVDDGFPSNPTALALARLAAPPTALLELSANHRAAIAGARRRPLGFCHLLVQESWWLVTKNLGSGLPDRLRSSYGLILGNGACLDAPREGHDLQAHLLTLFAHAYSAAGDRTRTVETAALARAHLARGKGKAEPKASLLEVEAKVAACDGQPGISWLLLEEGRHLLDGYEPADREAEILLLQGTIIARYREEHYREESRPQAAEALCKGLAILDQLEPGTNPSLRLGLTHRLAVVETDCLFYDRLLGKDHEGPDAAAIEQMVADQERLYKQYGDPEQGAERGAILGKILVDTDLERAQAGFRQAMAYYWQTGNRFAAKKLLRDLVFLWGRAGACGISGLNLSFLLGIWDLPEDEFGFCELIDDVEASFARLPEGAVHAAIGQLRRAVRAGSPKPGRLPAPGAETTKARSGS